MSDSEFSRDHKSITDFSVLILLFLHMAENEAFFGLCKKEACRVLAILSLLGEPNLRIIPSPVHFLTTVRYLFLEHEMLNPDVPNIGARSEIVMIEL